jgi:hypothetical protein
MVVFFGGRASRSEVLLESFLCFSLWKHKIKNTLLREFGCHVQIVDNFRKRGNIYTEWLLPSAVTNNEFCHNPANFSRESFWCLCVCVCVCVCERERERDKEIYRLQSRVFNMNLSIGRISTSFGFVVLTGVGPAKLSRYSDSLRAGRSGGRIPLSGEVSRTRSDRPWGSPSLLLMFVNVSN